MNWFEIVSREYLQPFSSVLPVLLGGLIGGFLVDIFFLRKIEIKIWETVSFFKKIANTIKALDKNDFSGHRKLKFKETCYSLLTHSVLTILFLYISGYIAFNANYGNNLIWDDVATFSFILGLFAFEIYLQIDSFMTREYFRKQAIWKKDDQE